MCSLQLLSEAAVVTKSIIPAEQALKSANSSYTKSYDLNIPEGDKCG